MSERPFYSDGRYQQMDDQEFRAKQAEIRGRHDSEREEFKAEYEQEQAEIRAEIADEFPPRVGPQGELIPADERRANQ
jgi:hypothetical protein